ncbi:hypothetical protein DKP78_21965, partial [Enterococcus faecium]
DDKLPGVGDRGAVASGTGNRPGAKQEPFGGTKRGQEGSTGLLKAPEVLWSKTVEEEETEGESSSEGED